MFAGCLINLRQWEKEGRKTATPTLRTPTSPFGMMMLLEAVMECVVC